MSELLPRGWAKCVMGDIAEVVGGGTPDSRDVKNFSVTAGVPWLTPADLSEHNEICISRGKRFLTEKGFRNSSARLLRKGAVLFSSRAPIGYVAIAANDLSTNQGFKSFVCADSIHPVYIFFYLKFAKPLAEELASGTTFAEISGKNARQIPVRLAPFSEQRRIAAKLEKLLDTVDSCQKRLAKIPILLKRLRQAVLAAACSGRLTADWRDLNDDVETASIAIERIRQLTMVTPVRRGVPEHVPMPEIVADWDLPQTWSCFSAAQLLRSGAFLDVKDGNHGANHPKVGEFTETGLPFITAAQVNEFRIDYDGAYKISGIPLERIRVGLAQPGDVIFTHKGSVGRVAVNQQRCILTPQTTYYRISPEVFSNRFLMFYLASSFFSEQVNIVKEQTTRDFVPISEQYLLFHRVPPLLEQIEIVRRVDELFSLADQVEARYAKAKHYVESLKQSILAKAFRGELVPQDPNDEPASTLLGRIREARGTKTMDRSKPRASKSRFAPQNPVL